MKPDLEKFNVQIIALSTDTAKQAHTHIERDSLSHLLLADPELQVIKQYGVEHEKAVGADSENIMSVFGMAFPMPYQIKFKSISIPTSILIDENGVIQWIDQSEDYRLRASQERVMNAVHDAFG